MSTRRPGSRSRSGLLSILAIASVSLIGACTVTSSATGSRPSAGMKVTSSAFSENGRIPAEHAGLGDCGGMNVSLPVAWTNLPANAKSVAVLLWDPDGANGLGVSHWVAYNIAADRRQLKSGEAQAGADFAMGPNVSGAAAYRGMCPPVGDLPHHYTLTVVASELPPGALPAGLGRDALLGALKGHALGGQSVVGLYSR
ncbi:YbhB/YbcL family Raf kinase inhibitor-like protein [Variovorax paradoxus]|nr:YbhB/YbcL family Raf kinase inhibitor-like protein [Variovorax paradoxus]